MAVDWADFVLFLAVVKELYDSINYFTKRGKNHDEVQTAAQKYREEQCKLFKNPDFAKLMEAGRTRLKVKDFLIASRFSGQNKNKNRKNYCFYLHMIFCIV